MMPDVVYDAYNSIKNKNAKVIYLTPQGKTLTQSKSKRIKQRKKNLYFYVGIMKE